MLKVNIMYKEVKDYETGQIIKVGETYRFADIWSGDGDEEEILESGAMGAAYDKELDEFIVADFEIVYKDEENIIQSIIRITDLR